MKSSPAAYKNKSLKTLFIYAGIVLFFISISLAIKSFFLIQQSRFDGKHQFILAIAKDKKVKEIVVFHPTDNSDTLIKIKGNDLSLSRIGKTLGIIPDASIAASSDLPLANIANTMRSVVLSYYSLKTDLTIFDAISLMFVSQKASLNNQTVKEIVLSKDVQAN